MNCVCGSLNFSSDAHDGFVTSAAGKSEPCSIPIEVCNTCGMVRQVDLPFATEAEYDLQYSTKYPPSKKAFTAGNYSHDANNAQKTFNRLGLALSKRVLDIGCGSGALVAYCRDKGIEAYGCELTRYHYAPENEFIYFKKFESIHFPTEHFDTIVCADVVEHVLDPIRFLKEIFRVLQPNGRCYMELPLFFHPDALGHWKRIEHIWYFKPEQLVKLVKRIGFLVNGTIEKEPTKVVFELSKPTQHRPSLLLPPGVGDVYWTLIKTESFLKREGLSEPVDAYVAAPRAKKYDSHARSFPFLEMFPFLYSTGEVKFNKKDPVWKEAYLEQGRSIFESVQGCDYFITWNGYLRAGKSLQEQAPDLKCNWYLPRFISLNEENYRKRAILQYGDYLLLYWVLVGTSKLLLEDISIKQIASAVNKIVGTTGLKPVLIGARWDKDDLELDKLAKMLPKNTVDLRGKTALEEVFGLIRGSQAVIGMNSGITIMSGVFGVKTILLYHRYLYTNGVHRNFAYNTFPPDTIHKTYFPEFADKVDWEIFSDRAIAVINDQPYTGPNYYDNNETAQTSEVVENPHDKAYVSIRNLAEELPERNNISTSVVCVLKSGGDYDIRYVEHLRNALSRNITVPYDLTCFTDMDISLDGVRIVQLDRNLAGWWSKVEIFREGIFDSNNIVYLDLDTVILGNIDDLLRLNSDFFALTPWNKKSRSNGLFASGIMIWDNGTCNFIFDEFDPDLVSRFKMGDQEYFHSKLKLKGIQYKSLQNYFAGIYSYKRNCRHELPKNARVICFHGRPRPHAIVEELDWVKQNWK